MDEQRGARGHDETVEALADALGQLRSLERRGRLAPELRPMAAALGRATAGALRSGDEAALAEVLAEAGALVWLAEAAPTAAKPEVAEPGAPVMNEQADPAAALMQAAPPETVPPEVEDNLPAPDEASPRQTALGRLRKLKAEGR